ncbi:MAG: hypothetical protein ACRENN_08030 [Candidatus Eiseniibacteriota bacterium]
MLELVEKLLERVLAHPRPEIISFTVSMSVALYGDSAQDPGVFIAGFIAAAFSFFWLFVRDMEHHMKERDREEFERWQRNRQSDAG